MVPRRWSQRLYILNCVVGKNTVTQPKTYKFAIKPISFIKLIHLIGWVDFDFSSIFNLQLSFLTITQSFIPLFIYLGFSLFIIFCHIRQLFESFSEILYTDAFIIIWQIAQKYCHIRLRIIISLRWYIWGLVWHSYSFSSSFDPFLVRNSIFDVIP